MQNPLPRGLLATSAETDEQRRVKFISPARASEITSLSPRQLDRLEAAGRFCGSVKLGFGRNGRKGYPEDEVFAWTRARLAERDERAA